MTTERSSYDNGGRDPVVATREDPDKLGDAAGGVVDRVSVTAEKQASVGLAKAGEAIAQTATAIRQTGEQLRTQQPQVAGFADTAAQQLDNVAQFVREQDLQGLIRRAEGFARRQPALFLGGAFALGLVASRFLKAAPEDGGSSGRVYASGYGGYGSGYGSRTDPRYDARYGSGSYRSGTYGSPSAYVSGSYGSAGEPGPDRGSTHETAYGAGGTGYAGSGAAGATETAGVMSTGATAGAEHGRA